MALSQIQMSTKPTRLGRRTLTPRASFSDDEDAITPCSSPAPEPQEPISQPQPHIRSPKFTPSRRNSSTAVIASRPASTSQVWHFDPTDGQDMDDSQLWERMLEIQRTFHCYNSARMSAALLELEMGVDVRHLARMYLFFFSTLFFFRDFWSCPIASWLRVRRLLLPACKETMLTNCL